MSGPGRPPKYGEVMELHNIRFPPFMWRRAVALARSREQDESRPVTAADVVRDALAVYLNLHELKRK